MAPKQQRVAKMRVKRIPCSCEDQKVRPCLPHDRQWTSQSESHRDSGLASATAAWSSRSWLSNVRWATLAKSY